MIQLVENSTDMPGLFGIGKERADQMIELFAKTKKELEVALEKDIHEVLRNNKDPESSDLLDMTQVLKAYIAYAQTENEQGFCIYWATRLCMDLQEHADNIAKSEALASVLKEIFK